MVINEWWFFIGDMLHSFALLISRFDVNIDFSTLLLRFKANEVVLWVLLVVFVFEKFFEEEVVFFIFVF
jgi:hypothetical protein